MYAEAKQMLQNDHDRLKDHADSFKDKIKIILEPYPTVDPVRNKVLSRGMASDSSFNENIQSFLEGYIGTITE